MGQARSIETHYAGCRFRSRLEARWAVCFDKIGVRWQYEAQGFHLPSGNYLPDFTVDLGNNNPFFIEIKGPMPDAHEFEVATEVNLYVAPLIILSGDLPRNRGEGTGWIFEKTTGEYAGEWSMTDPEKAIIFGAVGHQKVTIPLWEAGLTAGRSARFEFGQSG